MRQGSQILQLSQQYGMFSSSTNINITSNEYLAKQVLYKLQYFVLIRLTNYL